MEQERDINILIENLMGSCDSLEQACQTCFEISSDELTDDEREAIDEAIFCCETCSWWCESCENDGENNCNDCSELEED